MPVSVGVLLVPSHSRPDLFTESHGGGCYCVSESCCHVGFGLVCASAIASSRRAPRWASGTDWPGDPSCAQIRDCWSAQWWGNTVIYHPLLLIFYNMQILILKHSSPFAVATWLGWCCSLSNFWLVREWPLSLCCVLKSVKNKYSKS